MITYTTILTITIPLIIILYFIYNIIIYPYYLSPYKSLPRNKNAVKHWLTYLVDRFNGKVNVHLNLIQKYGNLIHLEDNFVLVQDLEFRKIYLTYKFKKDGIYTLFDINGPNLFSTVDKKFHISRKKLISPAFSIKSLNQMEPIIYKVGSDSLVKFINSNLAQNQSKEFDLFQLFHCNTLDVISELTFGKNLNTTWDLNKASIYLDSIEKTQKVMFFRLLVPFYNRVRLPLESMFKPLILENIKLRKESNEVHFDILQSLIDSKDPESGDFLTDLEIVDECLVLLFAGMDTTANTMTWTIYEILKHPDIYKLVSDEILEKFPNLEEPIPVEMAKSELKYLEACILESMRKNPVAAGPMPRVVPEGGITINGHYLPPKTVIAMDIYAQHNDPSIWKSPELYDIYRWLGSNRESNKSKLLSFGIGPTSCVGRELAWSEIYLVLSNLIRNFKMELIDKELTPSLKFLNKPKEKSLKVKLSIRV